MTQHSRNQHTVPECYLQYFSADKLKIFGKNKTPADSHKIPRNSELKKGRYIESQTIVPDHYTLSSFKYPMIIESNFYGYVVEKDYNDIYEILIDPNKKYFTPLERCKVFLSLLSLHCRTKKQFDLLLEIAKEHTTEEDLVKVKEDYKVAHIEKTLLHFIAAHQNKSIAIITLADNSQFLTSDNPVLIIDKNSTLQNLEFTEQFNSSNQIVLPINTKTCVVFLHTEDPRAILHIHRIENDITYAQSQNFMQIDSAEKTIYGSEEYLKSFFNVFTLT